MKNFKDSGIEWLGEIPQDWEVVKIKFLAIFYTGDSIKDSEKHKYCFSNNSIPYIATKDIDINTNVVNYNNGMFIEKINTNFKRAYGNSILLCLEGANAGKKIAFLNKEVCFVNKLCYVNSKSKKLISKFLFYFLQSVLFKNIFLSNIKGLIGGVTTEQFGNFYMLLLSLKEQEQIVNFLDEKCEQIANFIEKKEKLISLLKEQKQALINETITKGLNKNVNFKDSGIEWLGEIPQHWEVRKLKYLGNFQNGISINSEAFGAGYPFVSYGDVYNNISIPFNIKGLINSTIIDRKIYSVKQGDIFFTRTSETIDEIGISSVCLKTIENAVFAGFLIRFRANKKILDNNFAKFYFRRKLNQYFFAKENGLVTRASLSQELLGRLPVIIPPLKEQEQIANFLEEKCGKIDLLIEKTKKQIKLIKEYKTTLINQAVCGRMDL
ncbi:TPA: restriction endonuclease subunit S [Campylobacter jejuni]|nr:restriction endonuclease subunit S [Campylobacter jejuni]HDZ5001964.1 restriction endonuclease subunit S [Campylobacter jejuni]HDZ5018003.1 restriction endonuclease subunit S [Campylobacter jejuni]HDZ5020972.1 restriction endonuclease subunit S [Campylobacter jejuni]HDZ5035362.1 restriction endonuclease subunit S [Campylobacter jejuni]